MLQNNSVNHGDCLELMKNIPNKSVDMILTDLPYGMTQNSWDSIIPLDQLWEYWRTILKPNTVIVLTASQPFSSKIVSSNFKMFKHEWIWQKNRGSNFLNVVREPFKEHESILIFSDSNWKYNPQMEKRAESGFARQKTPVKTCTTPTSNYANGLKSKTLYLTETRLPSSVQKFNVETGLHPTQKPVKLFEYLIKTYTNEGDLILDCCAGSGTTALACINTNRNYICIEKEQKYIDIINKRISKKSNQKLEVFCK